MPATCSAAPGPPRARDTSAGRCPSASPTSSRPSDPGCSLPATYVPGRRTGWRVRLAMGRWSFASPTTYSPPELICSPGNTSGPPRLVMCARFGNMPSWMGKQPEEGLVSTQQTQAAVGAHLVGGLKASDAESAMRTAARILGRHLYAITDGETGERSQWIFWQLGKLTAVDGIEMAGTHGQPQAENPDYVVFPSLAIGSSVRG